MAIESIGVSSSAASCDAVTTDAATGNGKHVGPDTSSPGTTKVTYDTVPPSTGPHFAQPAGKKFALSHWSATLSADGTKVASQAGHRQLCGDLSGAVVKAFVQEFPLTSAPEPGAP